MKNVLDEYRMMYIGKADLCRSLGGDIHNATLERHVCVRTTDIINAIDLVLNDKKQRDDLVEWVNVIWFTELFYFLDKETDSIISVLEVLETLDEDDVFISDAELRAMQFALRENREYSASMEK